MTAIVEHKRQTSAQPSWTALRQAVYALPALGEGISEGGSCAVAFRTSGSSRESLTPEDLASSDPSDSGGYRRPGLFHLYQRSQPMDWLV